MLFQVNETHKYHELNVWLEDSTCLSVTVRKGNETPETVSAALRLLANQIDKDYG